MVNMHFYTHAVDMHLTVRSRYAAWRKGPARTTVMRSKSASLRH